FALSRIISVLEFALLLSLTGDFLDEGIWLLSGGASACVDVRFLQCGQMLAIEEYDTPTVGVLDVTIFLASAKEIFCVTFIVCISFSSTHRGHFREYDGCSALQLLHFGVDVHAFTVVSDF
ncbi:hypothetical protein AVEN_270969-1, partial [Araneus ventricosus]